MHVKANSKEFCDEKYIMKLIYEIHIFVMRIYILSK